MEFFVNLPLTYIQADRRYLDYFLANGLNPEFGLDAVSLTFSETWHVEVASTVKDRGLKCAFHLPFLDLQTGSIDPMVLEATRSQLALAFDLERIYHPEHMIGHALYNERVYFEDLYPGWLKRSVATWTGLSRNYPGHAPVYLENVFEPHPKPIVDLVKNLEENKFGVCFDIGHWYCFNGGMVKDDLDLWLETLGPFIKHLHLHDNNGAMDDHLGLGRGTIPWDRVFPKLAQCGIKPGMTLEPHSEDALTASLEFMKVHPKWFK